MIDDEEVLKQKSIEFYAASVNAWYTSALEHDKSIFGLAAGGIALLITLLTTIGFEGAITFTLFLVAVLAFLVTLGCLLWVFRLNQDYIEKTLSTGSLVVDPKLQYLDRAARWSFWIGVLFAAAVGFSAAFTSFEKKRNEKEAPMANDKSSQNKSVPTFDSVNGAARLSPEFTKSFHGVGGLQPTASAASSGPAASAPATPAPAAGSQASAQSTSTTTGSKP
jgi:hypothetical protein